MALITDEQYPRDGSVHGRIIGLKWTLVQPCRTVWHAVRVVDGQMGLNGLGFFALPCRSAGSGAALTQRGETHSKTT